MEHSQVNYDTLIPNNVGLSDDRRVLKALEKMASWIHRLVEEYGP